MRLLFIGDVVGQIGQNMIHEYLPRLKQDFKPQVTIVNGENAADGKGITEKIYKQLLQDGADVITMGNHTWDKRDIYDFIKDAKKMIRPANFPEGTPGNGMVTINVNGTKLLVMNLQGRVFLNDLDDPFRKADELLKAAKESTPFVFLDMHAETTSEKAAIAWYLDGKVSAVVGTHTHVQTNDARIFPKGTGFLTDAGMTGPYNGILGVKQDRVIQRFLTQQPVRFEVPDDGPGMLNGCYLELDDQTGHCKKITNLRIDPDHPYH